MNPLLATWYSDVAIGLSIDSLNARASAIEELAATVDRAQILALVAMAHEHFEDGEHAWFRTAFHKSDTSFLMRGNVREISLLAGACLVEICERADALAVLASAASALAKQVGWTAVLTDLPVVSEQRLLDLGTERRQFEARPATAPTALPTKALQATITKDLEGGVTPDAVAAALGRVIAAAESAADAASREYKALAIWAERSIDLLAEETQLLAWLLAGYSASLNAPWSSVDATTAATVAARELVELSYVVPAPPQADSMVEQLLSSMRFAKRGTTSVIPPLEVPEQLQFIVEQDATTRDAAEAGKLSLRQAVLLAAWDAAR